MGIHSRYAAAVLVLFTSSAFSATRVPVKPTSETVITGARTGAVSTPAGDVAFYGADKVYSFTAGDSVAPTVREVKSTVGSVSYPYGPGAAYPNDPSYSASAATKIKVKPVATVPKTKIITGLKNALKVNPTQLALSAATSAAVASVGWVMSDDNTKLRKKVSEGSTVPIGTYSYQAANWCGGQYFSGPTTAMACYIAERKAYLGTQYVVKAGRIDLSDTIYTLFTLESYDGHAFMESGNMKLFPQGTCAAPSRLANGECVAGEPTYADVTPSDIDSALDPFLSKQTAPWLAGLLKDVCAASISPSRCFAEMEDRSKRKLEGPSTVAGPWFTKTSTFPKPDGTTGTKTETTSTKYDFTYGPEHFDVNPERKTTTTEDGLVTSETTETDGTPAEDVADTPDEEAPPEESYTFNDSDLPAVEPFYTQKYPDGFQGVWDSANTDFEQSAFVSFLNSFVPSFSGSCPAFSMSFAIGGIANFGTHGFGNLCYALDFVKVCIMLGALFLCRAIVFGG